MKLSGRYAVITGANRGYGERIARAYLAEGASVLLCARDRQMLEKTRADLASGAQPSQKVVAQPVDVTHEKDVDALVRRALSEFPQVDILVNCAGVAGPRGPVGLDNWTEWKQTIDINLNGTVYACAAFLPHMKSRQYGKIINISGGGATKPLPHLSAYAASKAGIVRFTESMALEVKDDHIDVNAVAPGVLNTRIMDHFLEVEAKTIGQSYIEEAARQRANGAPAFERATALCVYLASGESDGITGRLISATWDPWQELHTHRDELSSSDIYTIRRIVPEDRGRKWGRGKS